MESKNLLNQLNNEAKFHSIRTAKIASIIAKNMHLDAELLYNIGLLHDIGKIFIPARILKKSTNLTPLEREVVDLHSYLGYRILDSYDFATDISIPVLYHHGMDKIKLTDVPLPTDEQLLHAQVIATADCFDALTNNRVYHQKCANEKTWEIIQKTEHCSQEALEVLKNIY